MKFFKQSWRMWVTAATLFTGIQASQAQTIIWGAGSGDPVSDSIGRFKGTSITDTVIATSGWMPTAVSHPAFGMWERNFSGDSRGDASATVATRLTLNSPSLSDGAAMFDSDYYYSVDGTSAPQSGYIVSPMIDLTGQTGAALNISMHTAYLDFQTTTSAIGFSTDGGQTWREVDVRTLAGPSGVRATFSGVVNMPISQDIATETDLDSCMIRLNFVGDSYYWLVDDVNIQTAQAYDLSISTATAGNTLGDAFTVGYVSNNFYQPISQVSADDYFMGARVLNSGASDILPANNAKLMLRIDRETSTNVWTNETLDSLAIDTVVAGERVTVADALASGWLPSQVGRYRATYYVKHDMPDATTAGDTSVHYFNITDSSGYYSKVPRATDGGVYVSTAGFPAAAGAGNLVSGFEWGNMYMFPAGARYRLDSVNFRLAIQNAGTGYTGGTVSVRVSKFVDLNGDGVLDDSPTSGELILQGLGTMDVTSVSNGFKRGSAQIISVNDGNPLVLSDTTIYLFSLSQDRAAGLENAAGQFFGYWYGYSDEHNYGLNAAFLSAIPTPLRTAEITSAGAPASNDWNWIGFGPDQVPSIGINMSPEVISTDRIAAPASHNLQLFPNPTENVLNVKVDLASASNVQYYITDMSGRVVRSNTSRNVLNETVTFNVADLAAGVYMVTVKTTEGISTERFVKQ